LHTENKGKEPDKKGEGAGKRKKSAEQDG
jgi:hypothetical protein